MKFKLSLALVCLFALSACDNDVVLNDGVPNVDPQNIIVDGTTMTPTEFLKKFCIGKNQNETCSKVRHKAQMDTERS
jgi:hypothetical protein